MLHNIPHHPEILYHYCSSETFLKIIQNKSLWLVNSKMSNDSTDTRLVIPIVKEVIEKKINNDNAPFFNFLQQIFDGVGGSDSYVSCFSKDGDLLSQWTQYAANAKGFAIGFNVSKLAIKLHLPMWHVGFEYSVGLQEVIYDHDQQKEIVTWMIEGALGKCNWSDVDTSVAAEASFCANNLIHLSPIFKNLKFRQEMEWRIIYNPLITTHPEKKDIQIIGGLRELKFFARESSIIPYFEFQFLNESIAEIISEIVLGPINPTPIPIVQMFLQSNGFKNTQVRKSDVPYQQYQ